MLNALLSAILLAQNPAPPAPAPQVQVPVPRIDRVRANDNRAKAGILYGKTLALRLEARIAEWHPNADGEPGAMIPVFAEIGRLPQIPGPLIRVPGGTEIVAVVRNLIPNTTLTIHGLHSRPIPVGSIAFNDSVVLTAGSAQTLRFKLDRPGTYYYWGTTTGAALGMRARDDAQLNGAIIVDEPGERQPKDRVLVIGSWTDTVRTETTRRQQRQLFVVNGRAWPYTDRMQYDRGDTVRWKLINASPDLHTMHLHGFPIRVSRRGDGKSDTSMAFRELVTSERLPAGGTATVSWIAERLGNWLFRSTIPADIEPRRSLGVVGAPQVVNASTPVPNALFGGLVSAIDVKLGEDDTASATFSVPVPVRKLRLVASPNVATSEIAPYFGLAMQDVTTNLPPEPTPDSGQRVGPTLLLTRGDAVSITLVNRLAEPTSLHWHGMDTDSYFDGVPGLSGTRPLVAPLIAPGDSFEVRFTPNRTGTFPYYSLVMPQRQWRAGLVGAVVVIDKPPATLPTNRVARAAIEAARYDPAREIPVVVSSPSDSTDEERAVLINGTLVPQPLMLKRATAYRLRLVNVTSGRSNLRFELLQDTTAMTWRPLAKDGFDLPAVGRGIRMARQPLSIAETMEFEWTPVRAGDYKLEARSALGTVLGALELKVR